MMFLSLLQRYYIVIKNISMLYLFSIANIVFPLLTLPYLTRILSVECYGIITYVKSCLTYFTIFLEFGFLLSATKDIVNADNNTVIMSKIVGTVMLAKLLLCFIAVLITFSLFEILSILRENKLFTLLSLAAVAINAFIPDYLFRGINAMNVITYRFILCKSISVFLTFVFVKNDSGLLMLPILDLATSILALVLSIVYMYKQGIKILRVSFRHVILKLNDSFMYFISNFATTAFGALCTVLIGVYLDIEDVAYWSLSIMLVGAAQAFFAPIMNGVYPYMISTRDLHLIKKILLVFMPMICIACSIAYLQAPLLLHIIGGEKYVAATLIFRMLLPVVVLSFPSMLFGWPCLGAINKYKETSVTTVVASLFQIILLMLLISVNHFTIVNIILARTATEALLCVTRGFYCYKYRTYFSANNIT